MENDDFKFDDIVLTTSTSMDSTYTVDINDYTVDTVTLSDVSVDINTGEFTFETTRDPKRTVLRESGDIPVDIWAKLYNNSILDIEDDDD